VLARNLEIKVQCTPVELSAIGGRSEKMGVERFELLRQIDTYFSVAQGRLKLRQIDSEDGSQLAELIAYHRANDSGSRWSDYQRVEIESERAQGLITALGISCGILIVVDKVRTVGLWRRTRIHLDEVAELGSYVELETVAGDDDLDEDIQSEHALAIRLLGLESLPVIAGSYSDLLKSQSANSKVRNDS